MPPSMTSMERHRARLCGCPARRLDPARRPRSVPGGGRGSAAAGACRRPVVVGGDGNPNRPRRVVATGVVRGTSVRDPVRHASRSGGPTLPRRRVSAIGSTRLRSCVGPSHDGVALPTGGGRGLGVGRSVRRGDHRRSRSARPHHQGDGARQHRADLCGGDRRDEAAGQDRHRVRQARWYRPAHTTNMVRNDGNPTRHGDLGHRAAHGGPSRGDGHPHRRRSGNLRPSGAGTEVRTAHRSVAQGARPRRR